MNTLTYTWEQKALEKYGKEVTDRLIESEKRWESKKQGNDCNSCGLNSDSSLIESNEGIPFIMHYGNFRYSSGKTKCCECGKVC